MPRYPVPLDQRFGRQLQDVFRRVTRLETRTAAIDSGMPLAVLPAQVDPDYTTGNPSIYVNGSSTLSAPCPYLASYQPQAGDSVLVVPLPVTAGLGQGVYLITGKIHGGQPAAVVGGEGSTLLYDAAPNPLPVDVVQAQQVEVQNTTAAKVPLQPTVKGNCLVVVVVTANATTNATVDTVEADNLADNFGALYSVGSATGGAGAIVSFWADPDCAGDQTEVEVTTQGGAGASLLSVFVMEAQGLANTLAGLLDRFTGNPSGGPSANWSSGSTAATTQANELWVGGAGSWTVPNQATGPGSPWTSALNESANPAVAGYQVVSAEGAATYAGTLATSAAWTAGVITLKPATPGSLLASLASTAFTDALGNDIPLGAGINAGQVLTSLLSGTVPATQIIAAGSIQQAQLSASITARTIGGITTTISATAPASPQTGDIWIDSAFGNQLNQWSGTVWVPITFTGTDVLAASTITAGLLAAGAVVAGNIAAGAIQAGALQAGAVIAGDVAAQSITASNLVVSYDGQVQQDSPIGWWKLDDPSGATTVQDYSSGGHPGTPTNVTFQQPQAVAAVPSASFHGSSAVVTTYQAPAFTTAFSIEIWVNTFGNTQSAFPCLIGTSDTGDTGFADVDLGVNLFVNGMTLVPSINIGNGTTVTGISFGAALPNSNAWTHLVATWDGAHVVLYRNGVQVSSTAFAGPIAAATKHTAIGSNCEGTGNQFHGLLSEAVIYNTALSAGRVAAHYAAQSGAIVAANIASDTITAEQIAAQTIGADLLIAGLVVAGIVDGTLIEGAILESVSGSGQTITISNGEIEWSLTTDFTPGGILGGGGLLTLNSGRTGIGDAAAQLEIQGEAESQSNVPTVQVGTGTALQLGEVTGATVSAVPAGAMLYANANGNATVTVKDGNPYQVERLTKGTAGQTVSGSGNILLTGMSGIPVLAGSYRISGQLYWTQGTADIAHTLGFQGSNLGAGTRVLFKGWPLSGNGQSTQFIFQLTNNTAGTFGGTVGTGTFVIEFEGILVFTAADTFGLFATEGADSWTALQGSWFDLMPV